MELIENKLVDYINEVDSPKAAPGGGSVAGLVGALGVALARMSGHFSFEKKKFKEASKKEQEKYILAFKELELYKDNLTRGVDDDALSYEEVNKAIASKDQGKIQIALNYSAMVAFEMIENSINAMFFASKLIKLGNKFLYSDLIAGAILLDSCAQMAYLNVKANAKMLTDESAKDKFINEGKELVEKGIKLRKKIVSEIDKMMIN